jgi:hypothetical protein
MEDLLPDITIVIREGPFSLLDHIRVIAENAGIRATVEPWGFTEDTGRMLVLTPATVPDGHEGLIVQVIAENDQVQRLHVEVRASHWRPDPPTYEIYIAAAKEVLQPLLRILTGVSQQYRLGIPQRQSLEPNLPPGARAKFNSFVNLANKSILHPLDWQRFYFFIGHCHATWVHCDPSELRCLLVHAGFSEESAKKLAEVYDHGRRLLKRGWPSRPDW